MAEAPVLMFDGVCNLCDGAVQFVLDHEQGRTLKFTALQSDAAARMLAETAGSALAQELHAGASASGDPTSMVLLDGGRVYTQSSAALRLARYLTWPWRWLGLFVVVPRPLRDLVYRWIARNRYRWFGKADACRVPTPELRARFL